MIYNEWIYQLIVGNAANEMIKFNNNIECFYEKPINS